MKTMRTGLPAIVSLLALTLSGCANTLQNMVKSPSVTLNAVEIVGLALTGQTFMLTFDVSNPNSFSLPISSVNYGVKLDGQQFASGSTASKFSVPANGDAQFAISVDLNLLQTAPMLLALVRRSANEDVPYELDGELAVDLPLVPTLPYRGSGSIRLASLAR